MQELASYRPRESWASQPIKFLEAFNDDIKFPKKLRDIFYLIFTEKSTRFIIKAPRGAGKSQLLAMIGMCLWFFKYRSCVDMGGSFSQAQEVYNYFKSYVEAAPGVGDQLVKPPTMTETKYTYGPNDSKSKYFKCVTASSKQVRGPHPDTLLIDEACEAKDELILAAMPMVQASENPMIIMTSTFHKIFGLFQETWDNAEERGYMRFSWDIFDVTKTFDPAIWDDPELNRKIDDLGKLKELAAGRTGDPDGFIHIRNVLDTWKTKPTLDHFLVESMGQRPSAKGLVLDPVDVDRAIFDPEETEKYNYTEGALTVMGIDWGFEGMTSVVELMGHSDRKKVMTYQENYQQVRSDVIIEDTVEQIVRHRVRFVYADSSHPFENAELQQAINKKLRTLGKNERFSCKVIPVNFGTEKEKMLSNFRSHFERDLVRIPNHFKEAKWQFKRYHYKKGSEKPAKEDDHIPDATMCAMQRWQMSEHKGEYRRSEEADEGGGTILGNVMDREF